VFGAIGYTDAHFLSGARSSGVDVSGKLLSSTPRYTGNVGAQYSVPAFGSRTVYGRAEVALTGSYKYDDANTAGQDAYSRATFRAGVRDKRVFAEAWIRNAFDTRYVPIAFAYGGLAPSGFIGELGAPRTFGVRAGVTF
jgi:hypothetical protein